MTERQTIEVHTIAQWQRLDPSTQAFLLQNVKLKDRLWGWLGSQNNRDLANRVSHEAAQWKPCLDCDQRGWVPIFPRAPGIHPSQIAQPCNLKIYKEMIGEDGQQQLEARVRMIMDLGSAVHRMFQHYGRKGAWGTKYYKDEIKVSGEYQELADLLMIEGHADADNILVIDVPGYPIYELGVVHEYKTINMNGFERLRSPKPEHRKQAMVYAAALDRPIVGYLYMNKNDCALVDFPVPFDERTWGEVRQLCEAMVGHYDRGVPPEGTTGNHCRDCAYVYTCEKYRDEMTRTPRRR